MAARHPCRNLSMVGPNFRAPFGLWLAWLSSNSRFRIGGRGSLVGDLDRLVL
jgi:hypothetical protein